MITANLRALLRSTPQARRWTLFQALLNAVPTARRHRFFRQTSRTTRLLCNSAEDSVEHLGRCPVAASAFRAVVHATGQQTLVSNASTMFLQSELGGDQMRTILVFWNVVLRCRSAFGRALEFHGHADLVAHLMERWSGSRARCWRTLSGDRLLCCDSLAGWHA